ncbi:MAG TPA: phage holin family protein [Actinomycetota bacterium]|nr:phage holin family protein [Actinomycetota bacterium]
MRSIARDTSILVRKEVELARQELTEALKARLKAVAALAAAGVLALLALAFLGAAAAEALEGPLSPWGARLAVAGGFLIVALGSLLFARARMRRPSLAPEETVRTVKEDVEWARAQLKR